jgi:hypothetical protein
MNIVKLGTDSMWLMVSGDNVLKFVGILIMGSFVSSIFLIPILFLSKGFNDFRDKLINYLENVLKLLNKSINTKIKAKNNFQYYVLLLLYYLKKLAYWILFFVSYSLGCNMCFSFWFNFAWVYLVIYNVLEYNLGLLVAIYYSSVSSIVSLAIYILFKIADNILENNNKRK